MSNDMEGVVPDNRRKKKILVLVDWFAPGYKAGGPIQSCVNFAFAMKNEFTIYVLTTDTDHGEAKPYEGIPSGQWTTNLHPDISIFYLKKVGLRPAQLYEQIEAVQADYLYLNHLFSPLFVIYPLWLKYRGKLKGQIVLCPRGALYDSALAVKPWKKTPFLKLFRWAGLHKRIIFHATNEREKAAIQQYFPGSSILIADNLPNSNQPSLRSCPKQPGAVKCIFIARIVPIKNLLFFLKVLQDTKSNIEFSIIGPVEDNEYWSECERQIGQLNDNIRVSYLGPKRNDELVPILQQHHLFVLPTTGENFGHSIFEAFLAGRPVLISDQTPWLGLAAKKAGWDLPLADPGAFGQAIEEIARWDQAIFDEWAQAAWQYAHQFIKNPELQRQYLKLFS
jgi:glycosyltransferase involved in cell wall biosynthesis